MTLKIQAFSTSQSFFSCLFPSCSYLLPFCTMFYVMYQKRTAPLSIVTKCISSNFLQANLVSSIWLVPAYLLLFCSWLIAGVSILLSHLKQLLPKMLSERNLSCSMFESSKLSFFKLQVDLTVPW